MKRKGTITAIALALTVIAFSSCGLFRKKNKCHTCPTWSQEQPLNDSERVNG